MKTVYILLITGLVLILLGLLIRAGWLTIMDAMTQNDETDD